MDDIFNQLYSKEVLKHFKKPKNVGVILDADGVGLVGNTVCGDIMKFYIKVGRNKEGIEYFKDVKFQTLGCGAAIATSSIITTLVKGKPLSEANKITKNAIVDALGGLPPVKIHCSVLADEGIKKALIDYKNKKRHKND